MSAESPARASRMRLGRSMGVATIALVALLLAAIAGIGLLGGTLVAGMAIGIGAALAAGWVALRASSRARIGEADLQRAQAEVAARIGALEDERATREAVLSALDEGVVVFDRSGASIYQNPAAAKLLGPFESIHGLGVSALRKLISEDPGGTLEFESEPAARTLQAIATSLSEDGAVLLVVRDVTSARATERVRRDFVANASHELKTPVASIRALAETIAAATGDPDRLDRFAGQLEHEAVRLSRIVSDLLDLSRLESGDRELTEVRLDQLVAEEAQRHRDRALEAGLDLTVDAGAPVVIEGSPEALALLVRNLIENAIQYTRPGGHIAVSVTSNGEWASLSVRDTGIGIPARDRARVFERFYRVDRARSRQTGGTGLGLSIVKHVAENHAGRVALDSQLGKGSTFTVRLPLK